MCACGIQAVVVGTGTIVLFCIQILKGLGVEKVIAEEEKLDFAALCEKALATEEIITVRGIED